MIWVKVVKFSFSCYQFRLLDFYFFTIYEVFLRSLLLSFEREFFFFLVSQLVIVFFFFNDMVHGDNYS